MKNRNISLILAIFFFLCYAYSFVLALWGKPLYDKTGNIGYLLAFHLLAIINYLVLGIAMKVFNTSAILRKPELLFFLHGSLISLFPYNGYQSMGAILMAAALISSAISGRSIDNRS